MLVTKMLDSLEERREILYLRFAKQCLRHEKLKDVFPPKNSKSSNEKEKWSEVCSGKNFDREI